MAKGDEKLLRQLSLVSYLLSRGRPSSAEEISRVVEGYADMSPETFTRRFHADRRDLMQSGIDIEVSTDPMSDREVYSLPPENFYLPDVELSPEETRSLSIALGLLEGSFPYVRPLRMALAGLTHGHLDFAEEAARIPVAIPEDGELQRLGAHLARLEDAVARRKCVRFEYYSAYRDATEKREFEPYGLFRLGGHWYTVGRDVRRDAERMFRLSRIGSTIDFATKKPRDFTVPDTYDPGRYLHRPSWLLDDPVGTAVIAVDPEIAWWVERSYPSMRRVSPAEEPDGWARFEAPYADGRSLAAWVLELGRRAELVQPVELREEIAERLDEIIRLHRAGGAGA